MRWRCSWALRRNRDVLDLEVLLDPLEAALAADAGLLDAPERSAGVRHHALVEPDHAALEALDHAQTALQVARVDVGDEAVLRVVGRRDRLLLGAERRHRRDR